MSVTINVKERNIVMNNRIVVEGTGDVASGDASCILAGADFPRTANVNEWRESVTHDSVCDVVRCTKRNCSTTST